MTDANFRVLQGRPPLCSLPAHATHCHMHFFDSQAYKASASGPPPPQDASLSDYQKIHAWLGLERVVLVQSNAYQKDNTSIEDEIDALSAVWEGLEAEDPGRDGVRLFDELPYQAGSWKRERRVIAKLEHNAIGANQRYIVTSLDGDPEQLYSEVYCERGTMENRHKEAQMGLFADRTSCHAWWSNQLRVMFSALAYVLLQEIRQTALQGKVLAKAQVWTLREKLLRIGAVVLSNTRRIELRLSSTHLHKDLFIQTLLRLRAT